MLQINGKTFMNLQEAVQWLLDNNALPFQANISFIANTEIAKSAIINPSPASIKVGALVLFADSKIGTVSAVSTNSFMVGSEYTDIKTALNYIANVQVDGNAKLLVTFSDGTIIDAGLIKEISSFSIDGSQHLIAHFNNGTTQDLGAIFSGNINISGNLTATGTIDGDTVTGNEIIEKMSGYAFSTNPISNVTKEIIYAGASKTGNKLTLVMFFKVTKLAGYTGYDYNELGSFQIPVAVANKIYPNDLGGTCVAMGACQLFYSNTITKIDKLYNINKFGSTQLSFLVTGFNDMTEGTAYYGRIEATFLLSDNLAS